MASRIRGTFSNKNNGLTLWGVDDLIDKLSELGGNVEQAAEDALRATAEIVEADMRQFMMTEHKRPGPGPHTVDALGTVIEKNGTSIHGQTGFKMRNVPGAGDIPVGLPALFLDIGTTGGPHIKPSYFVYYAYRNNVEKIAQVQKETFKKYVSEALNKGGGQ